MDRSPFCLVEFYIYEKSQLISSLDNRVRFFYLVSYCLLSFAYDCFVYLPFCCLLYCYDLYHSLHTLGSGKYNCSRSYNYSHSCNSKNLLMIHHQQFDVVRP